MDDLGATLKTRVCIIDFNPTPAAAAADDIILLCRATHLTCQELLSRRSHHLKRHSRCYKDHYWANMEDLELQYRHYRKYALNPFKRPSSSSFAPARNWFHADPDDNNIIHNAAGVKSEAEWNNVKVVVAINVGLNYRCAVVGCKLKAMASTTFCHLHILQMLYKACLCFQECTGGKKFYINRRSRRGVELKCTGFDGECWIMKAFGLPT